MKSTIQAYITAYQSIDDILDNAQHYRGMAQHFPLTVSLNASGHTDPRQLASDLIRLWDMLTGKDVLVGKYIPSDIFLFFLRSMEKVSLRHSIGLRIVGLEKYPNIEVTDWNILEKIISYLLLLENFEKSHALSKIGAADHFSNIARCSTGRHLWILGQGDYVSPTVASSIIRHLQSSRPPDVISLAVGHSIQDHPKDNVLYEALHIRYTEAISSSIYRREYLCHIPLSSNRMWPHLESALEEVRLGDRAPHHLILGWHAQTHDQTFVYVAPFPNWSKTQSIFDEVVIERYQIALDSLANPSDRFVWFYSLDDLHYAKEMLQSGRMPTSVLASFWSALANAQLQSIQLRQNAPVMVSIFGDLAQQVLSAATYFKLKRECSLVYADFSHLSDAPRSCADLGSSWLLSAVGLKQSCFEVNSTPPNDAVWMFLDSMDQDFKFGLNTLGDRNIVQNFTFDIDLCNITSLFSPFNSDAPYACITLKQGKDLDEMMLLLGGVIEKLRGLIDVVVVISEGHVAKSIVKWIESYFPKTVWCDSVASDKHLIIMQHAKILVCSDSWLDMTAAALNPQALTFYYEQQLEHTDLTLTSLAQSFSFVHIPQNVVVSPPIV